MDGAEQEGAFVSSGGAPIPLPDVSRPLPPPVADVPDNLVPPVTAVELYTDNGTARREVAMWQADAADEMMRLYVQSLYPPRPLHEEGDGGMMGVVTAEGLPADEAPY